jgi:hypothetical protein
MGRKAFTPLAGGGTSVQSHNGSSCSWFRAFMLSLNEGTYFIDVEQAVVNGHPDAAVTSFDLTFVFLHTFVAPSLLLPLAFVLRHSPVLPRIFWPWAFLTGAVFEVLGLLGLLLPSATMPAILLLVMMLVWIVPAAANFAFRRLR